MVSQTTHPGRSTGTALDEFASFVAHEVRGPLTIILGNALLIQRCRSVDEAARDGLKDILLEVDELRTDS